MINDNFLNKITVQINKIHKLNTLKVVNFLRKEKNLGFANDNGAMFTANHVATDLSKSAGFKALTFNESNLITCLSNDYKYYNWIKEALKIYANKSDVVILISSSGMSKNMIEAAKYCKTKKIPLISFQDFRKKYS